MAVAPVPEGYHSVQPYLIVNGAKDLLEFIKNVFGATQTELMQAPDILFLRDTDGDGVADVCDMVVGGWKEITVAVDALGVAIDKDGSLYYGRGTFDYRNPLQTDKDGAPHWDPTQETGTVIKVSPDRKTKQIIATGIRFTVALAINRHGCRWR